MTAVRRSVRSVAACLLVAIVVSIAPTPAGAQSSGGGSPRPARIVIVSIPRLGWDDVVPVDMPTLTGLADHGAVGILSVRAIGRDTNPAEGYATLGAGNRMQGADADAGTYATNEIVESGRSAAAELEQSGRRPEGRFVIPGIEAIEQANRSTHQGAAIGALGSALHREDWTTTVVTDGAEWMDGRSAAGLGLVDGEGSIDAARTLVPAPVGVGLNGTDPEHLEEVVRLLPEKDVVALIELGDEARTDAEHGDRTARQAAARRVDRGLAAVVDSLDLRHDLVIVLGPVAPSPQAQPVPILAVGPGIDTGLLRSATTRRDGYVTLPDVAPSILSSIGVATPETMNGTPMTVVPDGRLGLDRLNSLRTAAAETRFVDRSAGKLMSTLPILFGAWALLMLVGTFVTQLGPWRARLLAFMRWIGLGMVATPAVAFSLSGFSTRGWGQPTWFAVLFGTALAVGTVAALLGRAWPERPWVAPAMVAGASWLVLVTDGFTGTRLQFDAALGNSPTVAGRFSGFGNLGFAVLAATTILLASVAVSAARQRSGRPRLGLATAAVLFAVAIVVDGAPSFGSDVGGALTLGFTAVLTLWLLAGRRVTWRPLVAAAVAGIALVGLFGWWDRSRPEDERSHLGRFLAGDHQARETVIRKAVSAGVSIYHSSLVWILLTTVVLVAAAWWGRRDRATALFPRGAMARTILVVAATCGVVGTLLNDSGVAVAAMMAFVLVPIAARSFTLGEDTP